MRELLVKVDRVTSTQEAQTLAALGVQEMTFTPGHPAGGPEDGRGVTHWEARQMMRCTPDVRWGLLISGGLTDPAAVHSLLLPGLRFVQSRHLDLAREVSEVAGLEFIAGDISADHDEDPAWTGAALQEERRQGAARSVVQVYPTVTDGWAQAIYPTSPFDELRESDVRSLATRFSFLVESDFRPEHLPELRGGPYLGVNLTLSPWQQTFEGVTRLLEACRRLTG